MGKSNSLGNRLIALALSIIMILGMLPTQAIALETTAVAQIGDVTYDSFAEAMAAVPTGTNQAKPAEATTIKLLKDTDYAFDVGTSNGSTTMNLKLDLDGKTLTLSPSVGSIGTKSNGIRVLAYSKLEVVNGTVVCSSETADNVKVGIANYGELILDNVQLEAGALTRYTVNNRGALTLKGATKVTTGGSSICAITNDPYDLYYTEDVDASVTCDSEEVSVDSILVERYARNSTNKGGVKLNISAGTFGKITEDGNDAVSVDYTVTGGTIGVANTEELEFALNMIDAGAEYSCPGKPVTIKLLNDMSGSFDVGISNGKAPKNIVLDLNTKMLTLSPSVGSIGTKSNGIRVLAYSKLEIKNGSLVCSDTVEDNVKVGIANYSELILDNVQLKAGALTRYTVNNRGALTLKGATKVTTGDSSICAITNDPYDLYYTKDVDASVTCDSEEVSVDSILVERYARNSTNKGGVKLNISAGYFGKIEEDGASAVGATYTITGGSFGSDISDFCSDGYKAVADENGNFVVKSNQTNFGFEKDEYKVTFGANGNKFTAIAQNANGEVTYSFATETDVAEINAQTGELTILKAGTVQVKVVAAGNSQYVEAEDTYTLVIEPAYAEVHSFSGGTVTGSGAADTVVSIDNAVLEWVAKDESIGRTQDGWWVGIKIVAPDGVDMSKAVYQRRSGGTYDGAEVTPFVPESDRYLGMWGLITAEYLESFSNSGKKLNYVWRFSWDGDDVYEQTIAITIDPNGITLKQSGFAFGIDEETITFGEDYTARVPSGGQADKVAYSVENVSESDTPIAEIDPETGKLTVKKAGTVKITATLSGDHYEDVSDSYVLIIQKADQTISTNENVTLTWQSDALSLADTFPLTGVNVQNAVQYSIPAEYHEIAEIQADKLVLKKAGDFAIQIKNGGDACYNESATITVNVTVKPASQTGFNFASGSDTVTYNEQDGISNEINKYTLSTSGGQAKDALGNDTEAVYSIVEGDCATLNNGVLTIEKAGTIKIAAYRKGNDQYADSATVEFILTVEEANQEFVDATVFQEAVPLTYGTLSYTRTVAVQTPNSGNAVVYTLSDNTIADINSATGEVTFKDNKVGTVTVTATVEGNECYNANSISYTITVSYLSTDAKPTVDASWHTGPVTITAPENYTISKTGTLSEAWTDTAVTFNTNDGAAQTEYVYLRNRNGDITDAIPVSNIKVDTQNPVNLDISYADPLGKVILNTITFGLYNVDTLDVTISAEDETSGIASLIYNYDGTDHEVPAARLNNGSYTFQIPVQYRDVVKFTAVDNAGLSTEKVDNQTIVLDTKHPTVQAGYAYVQSAAPRWENGILYTQGDVTITFTIDESNADLSGLELLNQNDVKTQMPVLTVDDRVEQITNWVFAEGKLTGSYTLSGAADHTVKLTYTDASGNELENPYEQKIRIDNTAPVITIEDKADNAPFNGEISKTDKTAVVTIVEHNFKHDEVEVVVTAQNILTQEVQVMDYTAYAKDAGNWHDDGDTHTLELPLTVDAVYTVTVDYTDLAGRKADQKIDKVTVDKVAATNLNINYETPISQLLLQGITFGFYKAKTEVTVTAEDITSGVNTIVLTYTKTDNTSNINKVTERVPLTVVPNGNVFTATYMLDPQADGSFSAVVTDKAGNTEEIIDQSNRLIVDSKVPGITVSYLTKETNTLVSFRDASGNKVENFQSAFNAYYNGDAIAQIQINEANFFEGVVDKNGNMVHQVMIKVTKTDDAGNVTVTEYLPADAAQLVAGAQEKSIAWNTNGDIHTVNIPFAGNGDYVLEIAYTDFSTNDAAIEGADGNIGVKSYVSKVITVDKTNPVITIEDKADNAPFNGEISKTDKTAVVTIVEHNFKHDEVEVVVTAKNILTQDVQVMDYTAYAKDDAKWDNNGDTHTLELPLTVDAVYEIAVRYTDLAGNSAEADDKVTVDKAVATNLQISYETPISQLLLQGVTLGFYKAKTVVTVTAEDITSGVDTIVLTYTKADGSSSINKADEESAITVKQDPNALNKFVATYDAIAQMDGSFSAVITDKAGNVANIEDTNDRIVVDDRQPDITVTYTPVANTTTATFRDGNQNVVNSFAEATRVYYDGNAKATITINEANFFEGVTDDNGKTVHEVLIKVTKTDKAGNKTVTEYLPNGAIPLVAGDVVLKRIAWSTTGDVHTVEVPFDGEGDYVLEIVYADFSDNDAAITGEDGNTGAKTYTSKTLTVDEEAPVITVLNPQNAAILDTEHTAKIQIVEHNFDAKDVEVTVVAEDIMTAKVGTIDFKAYAKERSHWTSAGNVHTLELPFTVDAVYSLIVNYTDLAGNNAEEKSDAFTVDKTAAPADKIRIEYSSSVVETIIEKLTFGFYKAEVVVTVTAEDLTSGVDYFELTYTRDPKATDAHAATEMWTLQAQPGVDAKTFTASKTIPAQARGSFSVVVYDKAGNPEDANDNGSMIVTDTVNSQIEVEFTELEYGKGFRDADNNIVAPGEAAKFYYNKDVTAKITIEEANFFEGKKAGANDESIVHQVVLKVTKTDDNGVVTVKEYLCAGAEQKVTGAQKEIIEWTTTGDVHTTSITFADDGDYVLEMSYQDFSGNDASISGTDGNSGNVNYTSRIITVDKTAPVIDITYNDVEPKNDNCYKDNRVATITVNEHNFKAEEFVVDVTATDIFTNGVDVMDYAAYAKNPVNWTHNGNIHTLKLTFSADARYTFSGSYVDMAGNSNPFDEPDFVVDHTPADNIQITYTTPVFSKIIEALTFGFYQSEVVVTVTAEDVTSGVDYFELTYTRDDDATDAHTDDFMQKLMAQPGADAKTFTASYTVPAQARGSYSVKVFDRAGNDSEADDHNSVIVTDTISPEIKVDFAAKDTDTKVHFVDADIKNVDTFAESTNAFFGGDVVATITVDEANFFEGKVCGENSEGIVHEIIIKVTKTDDNGVETVTEYLCAGAAQLVTGAAKEIIEWTTTGDVHTTSITFADDGDYVLEITYSDFSKNDSKLNGNDGVSATKTYTSKIITVDETAPVIDVTYGNTEVINTIENIKYFNKTQSAVIKVTEHNFRAEDIAAIVTAKNVVDTNVNVVDFAAQLANEANWKHNGNVHTAEVQYTVDANYTFDIDFVDLAMNASADYTKDLFTVDTTAPKNLTVSYSTSVLEQIKESITFGYYNAKMTVTITAEDETSGIYHFAYSYIKGKDVSGVNAELLDQAIKEAEITYEDKKAIATFEIPKMVLGADNQFNGTVEFIAYDRSERDSDLKDSKVIVVDNITPTAKITYNAPVQNANGISYYNGNINATIVINEANFDAADVVVTVTKDGANYPVKVFWADNSVDTHTGTFTLTQDGDYIVSVQYKDKSGNQMAAYTSNELTLDTTAPTINVSNIKANSANKDEQYGFVITFDDINLDASTIKPVLKAVMQNAEGIYTTVDVDLGSVKTVAAGRTYTYTVENLPDDGLYTLTCEVQDMSANGMSQVILEDGNTYDQVQFSINRTGSAFGYGNQFTEDMIAKYYIYSVDEDVVLVEVNVDPIEEYAVTVNGKELVEGTDYTTTQTSKDGEWSKRTYILKKSLFEAENEYSIIVTSTDKTNTTAFSDIKNLALRFVVDQTAPVLTIAGLTSGGRYQTDAQTVTLIPTDEGGRLNSLKVVLFDSDGKPLIDKKTGEDISLRFELAGEDLLKYLEENDGKVTFTIPDTTTVNNKVQIICNDCAVNAEDMTNEYNELFERVTVSQNQFLIFYANTPLFVGTIVGVLAIVAMIIFLIKRKKSSAKAKA